MSWLMEFKVFKSWTRP